MAGHLDLLPGRQIGIDLGQFTVDPSLEAFDLVDDADITAVVKVTQLLYLAFQLGNGFFKIKERVNGSVCHFQIRMSARG